LLGRGGGGCWGGFAGWRGDGGWRRLEPLGYFFEARNLEVEKERRSWMEGGGRLEEVGPGMERRLREDFGYRDGSVERAVARK